MKPSKVKSSQIISLILMLSMSSMLVVSGNANRAGTAGVSSSARAAETPSLVSDLSTYQGFAGMGALSSGCSGASFVQQGDSPVGAGSAPQSVAIGDFNLDGKPDLAVANDVSGNVTILLNNGGGFSQAAGSPVGAGSGPRSVAVGDFNLDGKLDLAVANVNSANVTILLGNGSGGFSQPPGSPIESVTTPIFVVVGDFNLDGKPDLAVANFRSNHVRILLGDGSGGFAEAAGSPVGVGSSPNSIAIGDFNLDGKPDLAVSNADSDNVTILLGTGSGGFTQSVGSPIGVGDFPRSVAVGDFNLDGKPDLAVANTDSKNVTILLGDGSGSFVQPVGSPVGVGSFALHVAVGDFNLDGKPDLGVATGPNHVTIMLGNGSGGFSQAAGSPFGTGTGPLFVAVGDFNLDGKPDLAIANQDSNNVTILVNTCDAFPCSSIGFMQPAGSPIDAGSAAHSVVVADFNLDGKPDLAVANFTSNDVTILLGNGGGGFIEPASSPAGVGTNPVSVAVADLNLDGKPDLVVTNFNSNSITILLGDGSGAFTQPAGSPLGVGAHPHSAAVGDFNLDGKPDIAVANGTPSHNVTILLGNGSGGFSESVGSPVGAGTQPTSVVVGDFNLDGKADLAVANEVSNNVTILLGNGSGGFTQSAGSPVGAGASPFSAALGDFNLDGKPDLAVANDVFAGTVTILLGNGSGGFVQPAGSPIGAGLNPFSVAVGDFNLDGKPDLAVANINSNNVTILLGNGSGGFTQPAGSPVGAGSCPTSVAVGDFNLDGKPDLAVANYDSNNVTIQLNTCTPCILTCPANQFANTGPEATMCCAVVTFPNPTTSGTCGAVTCSPASGSCFPVGATTVTCSDADGPSCSFTVTVTDNTPPTITCPANITVNAGASCPVATSAPVGFTVNATDNCTLQSVACSPPSGSNFPVGTTTVSCKATDVSGNMTTCNFTVTVFSFCLQDDSNPGNVVLVNASTGDFSFCCGGVPVASGRGALTSRGCIGSIDATKGDRKIHIQWDTSANNNAGTGTAFVQKLSSTTMCQITDRTMSDNTCQCSNAPPAASPKTPPNKAGSVSARLVAIQGRLPL